MSKDLILKKTVNMYANYGIRGVSMNQIAQALQISKKTLYEEFGNKEELVCSCIEHEMKRMEKLLNSTEKDARNPVEVVILITSSLFQYKTYFCPAFYRDLNRFHDASKIIERSMRDVTSRYVNHFQKGMEEGYFQQEFDYETISDIFLEQIYNQKSSHQSVAVFTYLRGICTEKGIKALGTFTPDTIKRNIYDYN